MKLRVLAVIVGMLLVFAQTIILALLAQPLAHGSTNYNVDDPIRMMFFLAGFLGYAAIAAVYVLFDKLVCSRLQVLSDEQWLHNGQGLDWMSGNDEIAGVAAMAKQLYVRNNESAERENVIADHALDLICSLNSSRTIVAINPASLAQLGYAPVSLMGRSFDRILADEEIARLNQALNNARSEGSPAQVDLQIKTMQGALKDFSWTCEWSESAGLYYCVARDISTQKQLERVKQEFLSMVSHDLRTPITSVRAFMTHLEEGGPYGTLSEKGKRHLHGVEDNLDRMIRLTTDLLDLDKLEAGRMQLDQNVFKAQDLLNQSASSVRQLAEQKRITLQIQETDLDVFGDIHRLSQVLVNLLSNAIKFAPEDSVVELNAVTTRHQVEFQVVDHGRGIPAHMVDLVFERYKQVEVADHTVKKGSGLGLAIAKALVDAHNGQIGVSSEEGKGTKFWFRIAKPKGRNTVSHNVVTK